MQPTLAAQLVLDQLRRPEVGPNSTFQNSRLSIYIVLWKLIGFCYFCPVVKKQYEVILYVTND